MKSRKIINGEVTAETVCIVQDADWAYHEEISQCFAILTNIKSLIFCLLYE